LIRVSSQGISMQTQQAAVNGILTATKR